MTETGKIGRQRMTEALMLTVASTDDDCRRTPTLVPLKKEDGDEG